MPKKLALGFVRTLYCSICSSSFDLEAEGVAGDIGIIPVAFCGVCKAGIRDFAEQTWGLAATGEYEILEMPAEECTCPDGAEDSCRNILCPRQ